MDCLINKEKVIELSEVHQIVQLGIFAFFKKNCNKNVILVNTLLINNKRCFY